MSDIGGMVDELIAAGTPAGLAAQIVAKAFAAGCEAAAFRERDAGRTAGAMRQQRYRDRNKASLNVTSVTCNETSQTVTERNESVTRDDASLSIERKKEEEKEVREPRKARASQLPDGWRPEFEAWAASIERLGSAQRAETELAKFRNHALDKGRVSKRWGAAWANWVDRALDYSGGTKGNSNGKRTIHDAARDLSARVRALDEPAPELCDGAGGSPFRLLPAR